MTTREGRGDDPPDNPGDGGEDAARRRAAHERRRRQVFGDVLDDATLDDRPEPGPSAPDRDRWLRDNVPPHHGE